MIVDSSALVALIEGEADGPRLAGVIKSGMPRMSVANWLETCMVLDNRTADHPRRLDELADSLRLELVPVTVEQVRVARDAHRRFGRGSGSPARLNYGDCFAYALAITTGEPLLFKGDDFAHTDVRSAMEELGRG